MLKRRLLLSSAAASALALCSVPVLADPRGHEHGRGPGHGPGRGPAHPGRPPKHHAGPPRHVPPGHAKHHRGRGAGPDRRFYRGDRLPSHYRTRHVVQDWRRYRLQQPPRGYQWVQLGADFVLIAVATGLIAQIVLSN